MKAVRVSTARFKYNMRPFVDLAKAGKRVIVTRDGTDDFVVTPCRPKGPPPDLSGLVDAQDHAGVDLDEPAFDSREESGSKLRALQTLPRCITPQGQDCAKRVECVRLAGALARVGAGSRYGRRESGSKLPLQTLARRVARPDEGARRPGAAKEKALQRESGATLEAGGPAEGARRG